MRDPRDPTCPGVGRRAVLAGAAALAPATSVLAQTPPNPRSMRPQEGDVLVRISGEGAGDPVKLESLIVDAPQILTWPKDAASGTVRDGSRLNQVLVMRFDPGTLDEETREHAADGVVAYGATCPHAQCPVTEYRKELGVLHCPCHNSEFDPRAAGKVTGGPAPRRLTPLPLKLEASEGVLIVAHPFLGKVGISTT
jgi:rieske iron-sulfur protein